MRHPSQLLYGRRQSNIDSKSIALRRAEAAVDYDKGPLAQYFLTYPDEVLSERRDNLLFNLVAPSMRRAKDIYSGKPFILRAEINSQPPTGGDALSERLRLRELLRESSDRHSLADDLADELMVDGGPLALRALSYTGLKAQLANYFGALGSIKDDLESYLSWRLLAQAENEARALAEMLDLLDSSHPAVGDCAGRLHYIVATEFAICDLEMSVSRANRGDWRDRPDDRCPTCEKMLPSLIEPGSDDSDYYTLLSADVYQEQLELVREIVNESRQRYQDGEESAALVKETLERVEGHALTLAPLHRREIASLFALRFNDSDGNYRQSYLDDFAGADFAERYRQSFLKSGEPYLESSEVASWLSGWMDERFYLTGYQVEQNIANNIRHWLSEQQLLGKFS